MFVPIRLGKLDEALDAVARGEEVVAVYRLRGYLAAVVAHARAEASVLATLRSGADRRRQLLDDAEGATSALLRQLKLNRELVPAAYRLRGTYEWLRSRRKQAER